MPQIIIREKDKTSAGTSEYSNFTVVVPGFVTNPPMADTFDENGIYECASQQDFVKKIGCIDTTNMSFTEEKEVTYTTEITGNLNDGYKVTTTTKPTKPGEQTTAETFNFWLTVKELPISKEAKTTKPTITKITTTKESSPIQIAIKGNRRVWVISGSTAKTAEGKEIELDASLKDVEVGEQVKAADIFVCSVSRNHYGNQIAYELLGLGYKVLYYNLGFINNKQDVSYINTWEPAIRKLEDKTTFEILKDKSAYDFRYIINGLLDKNKAANKAISDIAIANGDNTTENTIDKANSTDFQFIGRSDCIALMDVDEDVINIQNTQTENIKNIREWVNNLKLDPQIAKYSAIFTPAVFYSLPEKSAKTEVTYKNNKFPASFHYLACAISAARKNFAEWYAVAGYTRGVTSDYNIESTSIKLGEAAINALEPRSKVIGSSEDDILLDKAINILAKIRNNYYIWGNRTAAPLLVEGLKASHFLNIRQLCTTIKKQVYIACKRFTFDPNSEVLWINLTSAITPILERMKADQGITDYRIIKVPTDKKAMLKAKIRIIPIEAVEDFDIELSLEDSFGTVEAKI